MIKIKISADTPEERREAQRAIFQALEVQQLRKPAEDRARYVAYILAKLKENYQ